MQIFRAARHEDRDLFIGNERRVTLWREKSAPSLRAALKISPYVVAAFAKGITLACTLRLVWRNFEQQRGSRLRREQTLKSARNKGFSRVNGF